LDSEVAISGWVSKLRDLGKVKFIIVRDSKGTAQVTLKKGVVEESLLNVVNALNLEDIVFIQGTVVERKNAPSGKEIIPNKIEILSKAEVPLPLDISGKIESNLDTRLDWRVLDLRRLEIASLFKIQAKIVEGMEEHLRNVGYLKVFTPCLMGVASESGAEVFPVVYFEREAFLRQDPQLHRQLLIAAGFDKVYDLGPNWRSDPSHTPRHLCEYRACAVEFGFLHDEIDVMKVEENLVVAAVKKTIEDCEKELKLLDREILVPKTPFPKLEFPKVYEILDEFGKKIEFGEDYDRESELILWKYVKEKYGSNFFFVNKFPFKVKPFYVMKSDEDSQWARSVDLIYKGLELSSGGQREHRYNKIVSQIEEKRLNIDAMAWFVKFFKYGVPAHGGFCIGIERLIKQLLGIENIREVTLFPRTPERLVP
jgi:aspartyl-tRNA synthetase